MIEKYVAEKALVSDLYDELLYNGGKGFETYDVVCLEGWIKTNRDNGSIGFIELNDGTCFKSCQLVYNKDVVKNYDEVSKFLTGCGISVKGKLVLTPDAKQPFEIQCEEISLEAPCDDTYPLQKKRHSLEYLREIPHLRPRTNTFQAVMRIRSVLSMAIHEFYQSQGFIYVHAPIITANDAEGAGEAFIVTTREDGDYAKDFFGKKASLTVSGQLHVEAYALAFRDTYTFGPTFRAEPSNTARHASEFWMIEPEISFADLNDNMDLIEDMVRFCIEYVLKLCPDEMAFCDQFLQEGIIERLQKVVDSEFVRMPYTEAIDILEKSGVDFEYPVSWGMDLQSEHERYICEKVIDGPVFLTDYPKDIKAFYMRLNDDGKTVAACDLLVPGIGELVGGSQREERYDELLERMKDMNIPVEGMEWYLDLRKYGGVKHSGFGLGFERFLMYITGVANIRDVLPYPRTPNNCMF
ncbi:asparaginyl-tRNA synthetase [Bacilli bacterium PM5-3]|nr:asparaginyl-tRNA synthetase [Bacilli bacterium PM5-3]MDH6603427.1 asparaginyl-tRNA synthetase [Bacilli bacterium PM5-9]